MKDVNVIVAGGGSTSELRLLEWVGRKKVPVRVVRRCGDGVELLAAASTGIAHVVIVSSALPRLSRSMVLELEDSGCRMCGVAETTSEAQALKSIGIHDVFVEFDGSFTDWLVKEDLQSHDEEDGGEVAARGRIIGVWGPPGAPGTTSIAITLADELSRLGQDTLLVDGDPMGGGIATAFGVVDDVSGVLAVCRRAERGALDAAGLAQCARAVSPTLRLLTGVPRADRSVVIRSHMLDTLWNLCRLNLDWTVVDMGHVAPPLEENGRAVAIAGLFAQADLLFAVGGAEPLGIARLINGISDLRDAGVEGPMSTVVTRVRSSVLGRNPEQQILEALSKHLDICDPIFVNDDRGAWDKATCQGATLAEVASRSPARAAIRTVAASLVSAA